MVWTLVAIGTIAFSCVSTGITSLTLRRSWDLHVSSVRWLFFIFFTCYFAFTFARFGYIVLGVLNPRNSTIGIQSTTNRWRQLGVFAVLSSKVSHNALLTSVLVLGDSALFAVAVWTFPLVYELGFIATKSMDRGAEKEKAQIQWYGARVWLLVGLFGVVESGLAAVTRGYTTYTQPCLVFVYLTQFASFLYMVFHILRLKVVGRKYENVQGQFVTSPVYQRLSRIMLIYAIFTLQYQVASVVLYATLDPAPPFVDVLSLSALIYCLSGLALAITTMCSQACLLDACRCCLSDHVEAKMDARLKQGGDAGSPLTIQVHVEAADAPVVNPVFVFTDIQQSSALWGIEGGLVMQRATEIHDSILRALLTKYRGYEITTAGDAFRLAFHTIREAVEYCLDAQLQLLGAPWPKELHKQSPATKKQRAGHQLLFCGLRVRMGIHDAVETDGSLILDVHAVTGKMTYTGASVVIANEMGDLGDGGQVLVTQRIAAWLFQYSDLLGIPCSIEGVGDHRIPQLRAVMHVFQVMPTVLVRRKELFSMPRKTDRSPRTCHARNETASSRVSRVATECRRSLYDWRKRPCQGEHEDARGRHSPHYALQTSERRHSNLVTSTVQ